MEYIKNKKITANEIACFMLLVIGLAFPVWIIYLLFD